jgi:hypothetical protein
LHLPWAAQGESPSRDGQGAQLSPVKALILQLPLVQTSRQIREMLVGAHINMMMMIKPNTQQAAFPPPPDRTTPSSAMPKRGLAYLGSNKRCTPPSPQIMLQISIHGQLEAWWSSAAAGGAVKWCVLRFSSARKHAARPGSPPCCWSTVRFVVCQGHFQVGAKAPRSVRCRP